MKYPVLLFEFDLGVFAMGFAWACPFCDRDQIVTDENRDVSSEKFFTGKSAEGTIGFQSEAITCSNPDCNKTTVEVGIYPFVQGPNGSYANVRKPLFARRVLPEGTSKTLPEYIPKGIRNDYREACLIRDLSPKASATLARRCLQGMIRDFVKPATKSDKLFEEIKALEVAIVDGTAAREVSEDSIAALTAVRKIGNIGAHMEADVDVIVDVDPDEAQILIDLIESLLQDWYVERHKRRERFANTAALADRKSQELKDARAGQAALPAPDPAGVGTAGDLTEA